MTKDERENLEQAQMAELTKSAPLESHLAADNKVTVGVAEEKVDKRTLRIGWYGIAREDLPYGGILYPADWKFEIRAASGKEIAYFSTINTEDPLSVLDGINQVIRSCVKIISNNGLVSPTNIYEIDRMWFLLKIRDFTMPERENALIIKEKCPFKCSDEENQIELTCDNLVYKPLSEFALKYVDRERGGFTVKTKIGDIHFTPSTIEQSEIYKEWFMAQPEYQRDARFAARFHMYINPNFKAGKNPTDLIQDAYNNFYAISMETKKFAIYMKIEREIAPAIDDQIKYICPVCGKEVHTMLRFPGGLQDIFLINDIDSEFL